MGGLVAAWATFTPSFLWVFAGGPYIEALRGNKALAAALSAITAAVAGVILNLALWFALHVLFARLEPLGLSGLALEVPVWRSLNVPALVLAAGALFALFRLRLGMLAVFAGSAALGAAGQLVVAGWH